MAGPLLLPDHSHCEYCGDPIPFGETYCDDECRRKAEEDAKKQKHKDWIFYGVVAVAILSLVLSSLAV